MDVVVLDEYLLRGSLYLLATQPPGAGLLQQGAHAHRQIRVPSRESVDACGRIGRHRDAQSPEERNQARHVCLGEILQVHFLADVQRRVRSVRESIQVHCPAEHKEVLGQFAVQTAPLGEHRPQRVEEGIGCLGCQGANLVQQDENA